MFGVYYFGKQHFCIFNIIHVYFGYIYVGIIPAKGSFSLDWGQLVWSFQHIPDKGAKSVLSFIYWLPEVWQLRSLYYFANILGNAGRQI